MVAPRFVKIFSITVLVAFLVSSAESKGEGCAKINTNSDETAKKRLVILKSGDNSDHYKMMEDCYGKRVDRVGLKSDDKNALRVFSTSDKFIQGYSGTFTDSFVKALKKMKNVDYVEEEIEFKTQYAIPHKREVDDNPEKNDDRIDQAKRPTDGKYEFPDSAGEGVNIFVVDTGIRITQNEFKDGAKSRAKFGGSFCDGCNDEDENGHGTHVASIAAGKTLGVARKANVIAVRVLDAQGAGSNVGVIDGLNFVFDQHTKGKNKNSVVNMSLGGGFSKAVNEAVGKLTAAGIHVAVAAGNDGEDACKSSPASEPSAVTVGATEEDSEDITDFSNVGKCVTTFAPGRNIKGAGIKSNNDFAVFSGTSQATPHVAGALALMISKDGNKDPAALKDDLVKLSTKGVVKGIGKTGSPDSFLRTPAP